MEGGIGMSYTVFFRRYENKYLISAKEAEALLTGAGEHLVRDEHGRSVIRNLYFDTPDYRMIRRSIEKPSYKEKLRLRCYALPTHATTVFAEIKKKYKGIVYKRRIALPEGEAMSWLCEGAEPPSSQIAREIEYMRRLYTGLRPSAFISYEREAFYDRDCSGFRLTLDREIFARLERLSLCCDVGGERILPSDAALLEIKCGGAVPLWLTRLLTDLRIYKGSYSKYGTVYTTMIPKQRRLNDA